MYSEYTIVSESNTNLRRFTIYFKNKYTLSKYLTKNKKVVVKFGIVLED